MRYFSNFPKARHENVDIVLKPNLTEGKISLNQKSGDAIDFHALTLHTLSSLSGGFDIPQTDIRISLSDARCTEAFFALKDFWAKITKLTFGSGKLQMEFGDGFQKCMRFENDSKASDSLEAFESFYSTDYLMDMFTICPVLPRYLVLFRKEERFLIIRKRDRRIINRFHETVGHDQRNPE